jgi:hypothetical protein
MGHPKRRLNLGGSTPLTILERHGNTAETSCCHGCCMRKRSFTLIVSLLVVVSTAGLTGCSGLAGTRTSAASAPTGAATPRTHSGVTHPSGGSGAGGAGSLTAALTAPVAVSGHVDDTVTCTTGRQYRAVVAPTVIGGDNVSLQVLVSGYTGAGSYSAIVTASITPTGSAPTSVAGVPGIPVSLTSTGGSVDLSATGSGGHTLAGSFDWACS